MWRRRPALQGVAGRPGQVLPLGGQVQQSERACGVPPLGQRESEPRYQAEGDGAGGVLSSGKGPTQASNYSQI